VSLAQSLPYIEALNLLFCPCCASATFPFAVGFISRPVGALLFGHMGDTRGRGLCLLLSVILMGVPTVRACSFSAHAKQNLWQY
jgi:MFS family permease